MDNPIFEQIKDMYNKQTYFQKYGGQVWLAIIIVTIVSAVSGYFSASGNVNSVKKNWSKNRCNPGYMPFAGAMNNDKSISGMEYTEHNFTYCIQNTLGNIAHVFLEPLVTAIEVLESTISDMAEAFSSLTGMFNALRNFLEKFLNAIIQIILNILLVFKGILNAVDSILARLLGINHVFINMGRAGAKSVSSIVMYIFTVLLEICIGIIVAGLALITVGMGIPFFGAILVALGVIILVIGILFLLILLLIVMPIALAVTGVVEVFEDI